MTILLVVCGFVALLLPGLRPAMVARGNPDWFVRLQAAALLLGATSLFLGLTLSAAVGALHLASGTTRLGAGGHLAPGGLVESVISFGLLCVLVGRASFAAVRARRGQRAARATGWLGHHEHLADHDLVVLPTSAPLAYSVSGFPPQVIISNGLRDRFESELVEFVIDHERAHLRYRHRRYVVLAFLIESTLGRVPPFARSGLSLRLAVERAADEEAAGPERGRRTALGTRLGVLASGLSLGCSADALAYRSRLLRDPRRQPSWYEFAAAAGLVALAGFTFLALVHASGDLPSLVASLHG